MALAYAKTGCHVLFVDPSSKAPLDLRSAVQRGKDDAAEVERTGDPKATAPTGLYLATSNETLLKRYWTRAEKDGVEPNIALHCEWSLLVCVDADTAAEVRGVQELGDPENPERYSLTTRSPGQRNSVGEWIHKDGGHFVFTVPAGTPLLDDFKLSGGAVVSMKGRYFLVPPSERPEGPYTNVGPVRSLSDAPWLRAAMAEQWESSKVRVAERTAKAAERVERLDAGEGVELATSIIEFADSHPWTDLLATSGWTPNHTGRNGRPLRSQRLDMCGCPTWTAPGDHADGKSATAHEDGCTSDRVDIEGGSGPLQMWTDNPPAGMSKANGRSRWTKAQFVTDTRHGGDTRAFLTAEGIETGSSNLLDPSEFAFGDASSFDSLGGDAGPSAPVSTLTADEIEMFWSSSPELRTIRAFAYSRMTSPWSVLACVLARVCTLIPNTVALPPIVGGAASLNTFFALMGATGTGKGSSESTAKALVGPTGVFETEIGSGEGVGHVYGRTNPKIAHTEVVRTAALFSVPEIGNLNALVGRQASTLTPILCKAWMSEPLGNAYAGKTNALYIPKHSYRMALTVGVQPEHADVLIDSSTSGLLQRVVWFPTSDKSIPRDAAEPDRLDLSPIAARWPRDPLVLPAGATESDRNGAGEDSDAGGAFARMTEIDERELTLVSVDPAIVAELRERQWLRATGDETVTSLDSHRNLSKLKIAAVLSVLEGRGGDVDLDTWSRAELLMRKSDETRASVMRTINRTAAEQGRKRVETAVRTQVATAAAIESDRERKLTARVLRLVVEGGVEGVGGAVLKKRNASSPKDLLEDVIQKLVKDGRIYAAAVEYHGQPGVKYVAV